MENNQDAIYGCGDQRIEDLAGKDGSLPDIIIILMGTNDLRKNIPISVDESASNIFAEETFYKAYALMLDKIQKAYPDTKIFCCTMIEVSQKDKQGTRSIFRNKLCLTSNDYNICIKEIAELKGASIIDVYNCGINYENSQIYTSDGVHPNVEGAKLIANKVIEDLYKYYKK